MTTTPNPPLGGDANPENTVRPTHRPSSIRIDKVILQLLTDSGVTPVPGVHFVLLTESGATEVYWPNEYALGVAKLLQQQATGLTIARDIPDARS